MKSVIWAQFSKDKRNPLTVLLFIMGSILATLLFARGAYTPTVVPIFSDDENAIAIESKWEVLLNDNHAIQFVITEPDQARQDVRDGNADVAVKLMESDYQLVAANELPGVSFVRQHVEKVFLREAQIAAITQSEDEEKFRSEIEDYLSNAPFQVVSQGLDNEEIPNYDIRTQLLFAFTFLVSMFIAGFKVNNVMQDKVSGIWDRLKMSPMGKESMYLGYIIYSFLITLFQITVVLLVFKYILNYDVGDNLWIIILISAFFTFSMISVAMLITGLVRTPEQFYAVYPSFIPLIPLISGAYMMPGTITNPILLFIADLFPLKHAMDAILSVVFYNAGIADITMSLIIMLLIGTVAMGIGINLIERRSN
ncbi:ABC transporter permease [Sporosarcina sp. USHLN248]|uniref:ABC transporter permease n=1 Tax=Sporosarcina sp. USHLN248 TaxID=3081300 RepID=UPI00301A2D36